MSSKGLNRFLASVAALLMLSCLNASAQFKEEAFSQKYNDDPAEQADSTDKIFDFKEFARGLSHRREASCKTMFEGSLVVVGGMQIYNKDYWKLPIVYGGMAAGIGTGLYFNSQDNKRAATACFVGAGVAYWASLMDGVVCYKPDTYPTPAKATIYSLLVPGLGQIYNHEMWKLPIYIGGIIGSFYYHDLYKNNYERFRDIMKMGDASPIPQQQAKYYRDLYRRYRDYATLAICGFYLLQVIDANVFAYMHNFEVTEDLALYTAPALITPEFTQGFGSLSYREGSNVAAGLTVGIRF